jgi:hypothetical protein
LRRGWGGEEGGFGIMAQTFSGFGECLTNNITLSASDAITKIPKYLLPVTEKICIILHFDQAG